MRKLSFFVLIIMISLAFSGCTAGGTAIDSTDTGSLLKDIPTPEAGKAIVYGQVNLSNGQNLEANLFLSKNIAAERPDMPAALAFSYQHDPRATQNSQGEFIFTGVEPGQYALVFWNAESMKVVPSAESSGQFMLVDVLEGQTIDLGKVDVP